MDYQHPAGPVTQGDTDTITATATSGSDTGSDAVTLTPQWAHITIETRPDSQSPYTMTTNTTVHVNPGEHVQLRITLTRVRRHTHRSSSPGTAKPARSR